MKRGINTIVLFIFLSISFISCLPEEEMSSPDTGFGTLVRNNEGRLLVKLDWLGLADPITGLPNGDHIWAAGDRIFLEFYTKEITTDESSNLKIEILNIGLIKTENPFIITSSKQDTLGIEPFYEIENSHITSAIWITDNFLTISPYFFYTDLAKHKVSLALHNLEELISRSDTINLKLHHKIYDNDKGTKLNPSLVKSFTLTKLANQLSGRSSVVLAIEYPVIKATSISESLQVEKKYLTWEVDYSGEPNINARIDKE